MDGNPMTTTSKVLQPMSNSLKQHSVFSYLKLKQTEQTKPTTNSGYPQRCFERGRSLRQYKCSSFRLTVSKESATPCSAAQQLLWAPQCRGLHVLTGGSALSYLLRRSFFSSLLRQLSRCLLMYASGIATPQTGQSTERKGECCYCCIRLSRNQAEKLLSKMKIQNCKFGFMFFNKKADLRGTFPFSTCLQSTHTPHSMYHQNASHLPPCSWRARKL